MTVRILAQFAQWFDEIVIIAGNHDDRIARKTGGEVHLGMLIPDELAKYSRCSYAYIETRKRGLIKVVHPDNFSSTPVALGQQFYDVEYGPYFDEANPFETLRKCHFVISHTHIDQSGWSKDRIHEIHAIGTCRDRRRTAYIAKGQNKYLDIRQNPPKRKDFRWPQAGHGQTLAQDVER
jgi:hypothetical protein